MRSGIGLPLLVFVFLTFYACNPQDKPIPEEPQTQEKETETAPPNIILIIGDGAGISQLSTLWYYGTERPNYERFKFVGLSKTNSSSHKITDSAAGATAFSIGEKTYNGAIGVDQDSVSKENITEILSKKGYSTGVVATSTITHATPASFYAHVKSRNEHYEIASQLVGSEIDFFAGGGIKYFARRPDGRNLLNEFKSEGFALDTNDLTTPLNSEKVGYLLAADAMPTIIEGRGDFLPNASKKALDFLSAKNQPFFLMIEASQVDWGGHGNDDEYIITETHDLDKTVGVALDFAEKYPNTLVVALADHETGGYGISPVTIQGFGGIVHDDYDKLEGKFTTKGHTCEHIPVFSSGIGAIAFAGIYENHTVFDKMLSCLEQTN